jgi:hypothetical protein
MARGGANGTLLSRRLTEEIGRGKILPTPPFAIPDLSSSASRVRSVAPVSAAGTEPIGGSSGSGKLDSGDEVPVLPAEIDLLPLSPK